MRRRSRSENHDRVGHERWLVSYADFITLLFAFFVVLYASSHLDNKKLVQMASAIQGAFQQLDAIPGDSGSTPGQEMAAPIAVPVQAGTPLEVEATSDIDVEALRRELQSALGDEIKHHEIEIRVTPLGFVVSLKELGFFNSGEARLLPEALSKLTRIAKILNEHGFEVRVEGHTDDRPIHTAQFRSNWELSTARATEVVTVLVQRYGMDPGRVSVAGYAEFRPMADNATPEGRQMNRRVDIVVVSHAHVRAMSAGSSVR